ncbi:kinetochore Sim4 complex subunit FTA2-domain-containing protein [Xylaria scruposa]|nr:kinetochore Sim4 complex subunit FTA2-domain-containing protein [Xylaria scruposa]
MARRGRPPLKRPAQRETLPRNQDLKKTAGHHAERGRPPPKRNKIESPISPSSLYPPPMIHPFKDQEPSIEWGERLDDIPGSGSEIKSFVFKVKINSEPYVLKVFKFIDPQSQIWELPSRLREAYPLEKLMVYTDPFYAECRAYGRIKEAVDRGEIREKIAAKCHGYIFLNSIDEKWLINHGIDLGTKILDDQLRQIVGGAGKPRAIVKDFEIAGPDLDEQTPQQIRRSFRSIWQLNQLGIFNRDVRTENFRNGWLVDFDTSYTLPHAIYSTLSPFEAAATRGRDEVKFDEMLKEAGINLRFHRKKRYDFRSRLKEFRYEEGQRVD